MKAPRIPTTILMIALTFISGVIPTALAFDDLDDTNYSDSINELKELGIVSGYPDGNFRPSQEVNRAEMLKIAVEAAIKGGRLDQAELEEFDSQSCFPDVPAANWYTQYVCYAESKGWVKGYQDGFFRPNTTVSFVESLKMNMQVFDLGYEEPTDGPWYSLALQKAQSLELIPQTVDNVEAPMNRGEVAELAVRTKSDETRTAAADLETSGSSTTNNTGSTTTNGGTNSTNTNTSTSSTGRTGGNRGGRLPSGGGTVESTPQVQTYPDLTISGAAASSTVGLGSRITITYTYTNSGDAAAAGSTITATVPAGTTFNQANSGSWSCADASPATTECVHTIGSILATGTGTVDFALNTLSSGLGAVTTSASIATTTTESNSGNNSDSTAATVVAPDLSVTVTAGSDIYNGNVASYTLAYANGGTSTATGSTISVTVPTGTTFNSSTSTGSWDCSNGATEGTDCTLTIGNIAASGSSSNVFAVNTLNDALGSLSVSASITDTGTNGNDSDNSDNSDSDSLNNTIRAYSGMSCPTFTDETTTNITSASETRVVYVDIPDGTYSDYGIIFAWHYNGGTPTEMVVDADLDDLAGLQTSYSNYIIVAPEDLNSDSGGGDPTTYDWATGYTPATNIDLILFDDVIACLSSAYTIDLDRVWSLGRSGGAAWTSFLTLHRADVLAGSMIFSGGLENPSQYQTPARLAPVVLAWGGATDAVDLGSDQSPYNDPGNINAFSFGVASQDLSSSLRGDGHFVIECNDVYNGHNEMQNFYNGTPITFVSTMIQAYTRASTLTPDDSVPAGLSGFTSCSAPGTP